MTRLAICLIAIGLTAQQPAQGPSPVTYRLSFPEAEHRWMQVEAMFPEVGANQPLDVLMSRSSPGRYAQHDFAKNIFELRAHDSKGTELNATRQGPHQWTVAGHDGSVRLVYRIYGDYADGTYLAVDSSHAHVNMPASLMWARGLDDRPVRVTFEPPRNSGWRVATQLYPTSQAMTFTAPNLQYLMDSPAELSALTMREFTVRGPDGRDARIRIALHHDGSDGDADALASDVQKIVREQVAVFGEFPEYETGAYTFLLDYLPWVMGDGMEHRNSSVITAPLSTANPTQRRAALQTISHEFFHGWNVERIRPRSLEPFDYTQVNISSELWFAEGFTSYYGPLAIHRAGLSDLNDLLRDVGFGLEAVINGSGRRFRSAAESSRTAAFADGARYADRTNLSATYISYYTYGAVIGLGLDLTLRDRSDNKVTLDDYLRALWHKYGKPGAPAPGFVAVPYTMQDLRDTLAQVAGDQAFADRFFDRYIEGRDVVDYAALLSRAGFVLRRRQSSRGWIGDLGLDSEGKGVRVGRLVSPGSPAYAAGLEQDDVLTAVNGRPVVSTADVEFALREVRAGSRIPVTFLRRGQSTRTTIAAVQDPSLDVLMLEATGGTITPAQRTFRARWLASKAQ
ncbi:MAG TPA: PDZ domain-containing protein [Vicinamibacterales bacterium]|jgi:predicted metalloprotease with PDZ domain|nr:PDZ domain-containing protein [Vicinamibacterales bacterium]